MAVKKTVGGLQRLFRNDVHGNRGFDFGIKVHTDLVVTDLSQRVAE
jgi:hypothetical protein